MTYISNTLGDGPCPRNEGATRDPEGVFALLARKTSEERFNALKRLCKERDYNTKVITRNIRRDIFSLENISTRNIVVWANGTNDALPTRMVTAHYDIVNAKSENANDNGSGISIILRFLEDKEFPKDRNIVVVFLDKEERGGLGARSLARMIHKNVFGNVEFVLNLDVCGIGSNIYVDEANLPVGKIAASVGCIPRCVPFNDATAFRMEGVASACLVAAYTSIGNDMDSWVNLHTERDTIASLNFDMLDRALTMTKKILGATDGTGGRK